jgi:hypothetical protein
MARQLWVLASAFCALGPTGQGAEMSIDSGPYSQADLFCAPLVPQVGEAVTITVRVRLLHTQDDRKLRSCVAAWTDL